MNKILILVLTLLIGANINAQTCFTYTALPSQSEIVCSIDSLSYTVTALPDLAGCDYTFSGTDLTTNATEEPFTGSLGELCICFDDICDGADSIKVTQTVYYNETETLTTCDTIIVNIPPCAELGEGDDICTILASNPSSPLATEDCDNGGIDNATECDNGGDPNDPNDDVAKLVITKTASVDKWETNVPFTYTITVENTSAYTATGVEITDAGLATCLVTTDPTTLVIGDLITGATATLIITVTPIDCTTSTDITNTATVISNETPSDSASVILPNEPCAECVEILYGDNNTGTTFPSMVVNTVGTPSDLRGTANTFINETVNWTLTNINKCGEPCNVAELIPTGAFGQIEWYNNASNVLATLGINVAIGTSPYPLTASGNFAKYWTVITQCGCGSLSLTFESENGTEVTYNFDSEEFESCTAPLYNLGKTALDCLPDCTAVEFCPVYDGALGELGVTVTDGTAPYITQWEIISYADGIIITSINVTDANGCTCDVLFTSNVSENSWNTNTEYDSAEEFLAYLETVELSTLPNYNNLGDLGLITTDEILESTDYAISSGCNCSVVDPCNLGGDICATLTANPSSPLATLDCDNGGIDNATECANGGNPNDASDDIACNVDCIKLGANATLYCEGDYFWSTADDDFGAIPAGYVGVNYYPVLTGCTEDYTIDWEFSLDGTNFINVSDIGITNGGLTLNQEEGNGASNISLPDEASATFGNSYVRVTLSKTDCPDTVLGLFFDVEHVNVHPSIIQIAESVTVSIQPYNTTTGMLEGTLAPVLTHQLSDCN